MKLFGRGPGSGSGRGGPMGTPSQLVDEASPSSDQEANAVVSGGGLVGPEDDEGPRDAARRSPSSQAPSRA
jgi:hypothetical protein